MSASGKDVLPKPQGAIAALFVGMLYPSGPDTLQLLTYRPRLIDTGKLDMLSPPWQRVGQPKASVSAREARVSAKLVDLTASIARHYAEEAIFELGLADVAKLVVKRVPSPELRGQIGVSCSLRLGGDTQLYADKGLPPAEELATQWGKAFQAKLRTALGRRKDTHAEWPEAPEGLSPAVQRWCMELHPTETDKARLDGWPQALLAFEERREIKRAAPERRARKPAADAPPRKPRL